MVILYLCDEYPPGKHGGIGTAVQTLARAMVRRGHTVIVAGFYDWAYGGEDYFVDAGVHVYRFRRLLSSTLWGAENNLLVKAAHKSLKVLRILEADIIYSLRKYGQFLNALISDHKVDLIEMPDYNDYMRFCRRVYQFPGLKAPIIIKLHGSATFIGNELGRPARTNIVAMEKTLIDAAVSVVAVSLYISAKTAEYFSYTKPVTILPNGIEPSGMLHPARNKNYRNVLFWGTLVANKGIFQLLKAWNIVHKSIPDAKLDIFGRGNIAQAAKFLTAESRDSVCFHGYKERPEIYKYAAAAAVAVFPSYAESFGLTIFEAMSCGVAVINANRSTGPELIQDGKDGLLIDPDDVERLAATIIEVLNDESFCNTLTENGFQKARHFYIDNICKLHESFYEKIITEGS